ncbi:hypothetical protein [Acidovorax radicis]|uniref:hypothetical protein n=1 Tax=Acidovorax radicis TaxID=758826 RepID=UPI0011121BCD|nr:hypothetical protein [Acidovorax radicis]
MFTIVDLVCGTAAVEDAYVDSDYVGMVKRLRSDLQNIDQQIGVVLSRDDVLPAAAVFPFLCRKFLELSLTSMLSRVDPLKVLAARKHQRLETYEEGKPNPSSIAWSGDIFPSEKTAAGASIWDVGGLKKGPERSLLGWHLSEVAFKPGLRWLTETKSSESAWVDEIAAVDDPFGMLRSRLGQIYSSLSKGVHAEYLVDEEVAFDNHAIQLYWIDSYRIVVLLAVATHVGPFFARSIAREDAYECMKFVEDRFN